LLVGTNVENWGVKKTVSGLARLLGEARGKGRQDTMKKKKQDSTLLGRPP